MQSQVVPRQFCTKVTSIHRRLKSPTLAIIRFTPWDQMCTREVKTYTLLNLEIDCSVCTSRHGPPDAFGGFCPGSEEYINIVHVQKKNVMLFKGSKGMNCWNERQQDKPLILCVKNDGNEGVYACNCRGLFPRQHQGRRYNKRRSCIVPPHNPKACSAL